MSKYLEALTLAGGINLFSLTTIKKYNFTNSFTIIGSNIGLLAGYSFIDSLKQDSKPHPKVLGYETSDPVIYAINIFLYTIVGRIGGSVLDYAWSGTENTEPEKPEQSWLSQGTDYIGQLAGNVSQYFGNSSDYGSPDQ